MVFSFSFQRNVLLVEFDRETDMRSIGTPCEIDRKQRLETAVKQKTGNPASDVFCRGYQ
jgi:hypothetical protein